MSLSARIAIVLAVVLMLIGAWALGEWRGDTKGAARVQQLWDKNRAKQAEAHAMAMQAAREKEQALQTSADQLRKDKDREIRHFNARAAALAHSLRNRPERPTTQARPVPETTSPGPTAAGCTGAELYRSDGEFLAREAARADELRIALKQCYAQYESVGAK